MKSKKKDYRDLSYLLNKPKFIRWCVVAGTRELNFYESYDLILDEHDLKIRQLKPSAYVSSISEDA